MAYSVSVPQAKSPIKNARFLGRFLLGLGAESGQAGGEVVANREIIDQTG
jgi:hypothetical protein